MQTIRLFFPLIISRQLITGANTAFAQEIKKLRRFGIDNIIPYIANFKFRKYPYKITFTYFTSSDIDMISTLTMSNYILHLFESLTTLQSTDFRVLPQLHIAIRKVVAKDKEGCEIKIEKL